MARVNTDILGISELRIDAVELWCWKRLLRVPRTVRRFNLFFLKEVSPEYSLEGLMLKLKLQYFGHLTQRTDPIWKDPDAGRLKVGEGDDKGWHGWMASPTQWTWVWVSLGLVMDTETWRAAVYRDHKESYTTGRLNWTKMDWNGWINSEDHYTYYCGKNPLEETEQPSYQEKRWKCTT